MKPNPIKSKVLNRGVPPDAFLSELVAWGRQAPNKLFEPNDHYDVYDSVILKLGPYTSTLHRKAVMLEIMRVLAGFESSWNWNEGRDWMNKTSDKPDTTEAGAWQVSANSRNFGSDLKALAPADGFEFQRVMKSNHDLAMTYIATLLRNTTRHNGPVLRHEIDPWLRKEAVQQFEELLS